jgi:pimeloyl-ACP methyl ester carboxylesterase
MNLFRRGVALAGGLALTLGAFAADELETATATSRDGIRIEYAVGGEGGPTLVFIHGWTCDRSYWSEQLPYFVRGHKVIAVDLAGHGASGAERDDYTMRSFGEDVAAAVGDEESVILIGHSMGGPVALQAARLLGDRVLGIVAVDSLNDTGGPVPEPAAIDARVAPLAADFVGQGRPFIESMFIEESDPALREQIVSDMLSADPAVAVSAVRNLLEMDYAATLAGLEAPLVLINSTYEATDIEALQAMHSDTRLVTMDGVGHFLMMEDPDRFNPLLASVVASTAAGGARVQSVDGFRQPEAVRYDPEQDVWFVANFNGDTNGDANGFVSRVSPDGEILELEFMTGTEAFPFHAGRGMYIDGDGLWVADAGGIHRFDRKTGEQLQFVDLTHLEPGFPNDIVKGRDGSLYVTDTRTSVIYRVADGEATIATETPFAANGITIDPDSGRLILAPWSGSDELVAWDPETNEFHTVAPLNGGGRYDGVEIFDGSIIAASQEDRSLHVVTDGKDERRIALTGRPADIGVDTKRGRIAVPYVALDRIDIIDWTD